MLQENLQLKEIQNKFKELVKRLHPDINGKNEENENKLKIKIISEPEPFYCKGCNEIKNSQCYFPKCKDIKKVKISGTKIRKLLIQKKKIPEYLMDSRISKKLSVKSIL